MLELPSEGRHRVVVEKVQPQVDCGRFATKRVVGESVMVEAAVFADGHDHVACQVLYWREGEDSEHSSPMKPLGNDLWRGGFPVQAVGRYCYTIEGWVDRFATWHADLMKRIAAGQDVRVDMLIGANLIEDALNRARGSDAEVLKRALPQVREVEERDAQASVVDAQLLEIMQRYPPPYSVSRHEKVLTVVVDREKARFSTWYEVFPRSCSDKPGQHGTFRDCEARLSYIASMGFDVVYLPPIHPIGRTFRKGKNNSPIAEDGDVGSPWAIGSEEGGHTSIHPQLGTHEDFRHFVSKAKEHGLEVALDVAFQCTPDHPYVREHRQWFQTRPDGTIQYAENPPKRYQDIYPLDFETTDWRALWMEMKAIFDFWIAQGVELFRVDNPHTKPFALWEWVIGEIKQRHPDVLFLAEAFTRPAVMYRLSELGFSQSYTYFAWRNTKQELMDYFRELTETDVREHFRPNLWPNTPDILTAFLQEGGRPAFMIRLVLAATLGASYGIYGGAFELCENIPYKPGSEEYLNSEKYEIKHRDMNAPWSLKEFIARVNRIRKESPALQSNSGLRFHGIDNPLLICYSKATEDLSDIIIVIVNLDPHNTQLGWTGLDLGLFGLAGNAAFQVHDLLGEGFYSWQGPRNYVELRPGSLPAHILRLHR